MSAGPADKSYGIHVAKLAGMPADLLKRADHILSSLEKKDVKLPTIPVSTKQQPETSKVKERTTHDVPQPPLVDPNGQLELFGSPAPKAKDPAAAKIIKQLKNLNLMEMTPMDVMNQIYQWQQKLK